MIEKYGAIGGKTTSLKEEFGLIELRKHTNEVSPHQKVGRGALQHYLKKSQWRQSQSRPVKGSIKDPNVSWASLSNFWFVA